MNSRPLLQLLLRNGAERDAKNLKGETPLDMAREFRALGTIELLGGSAAVKEVKGAQFKEKMDDFLWWLRIPSELFKTMARPPSDEPWEASSEGRVPLTLGERAQRLDEAIQSEVDCLARYVDMGAINSRDAEIDGGRWRDLYEGWR
ncbi:MAG: hypothetical protein RDV48_20390 [Candidatus Eremiobacteraeota bacterium]|nr:hypothetical protein [Candidatus Eremiobacteraeota bacterium]